jgi:hypothetical protein
VSIENHVPRAVEIYIDPRGPSKASVVGVETQEGYPYAVGTAPPVSTAPPEKWSRAEPGPMRGRKLLQAEMLDWLDHETDQRVLVLHGLPGVGKTTLASDIAYHAGKRGRRVWWVDATSRTSLVGGMHAVALQAGAQDHRLRHADAADVLWLCLASFPQRWLLVIDGADDPEALTDVGVVADGTGVGQKSSGCQRRRGGDQL